MVAGPIHYAGEIYRMEVRHQPVIINTEFSEHNWTT